MMALPPISKAERRGLVWHYTVGERLPEILRSGVLRPTRSRLNDEWFAVWFSTLRDWDPAVGLAGLTARTPEEAGGLARIGVAPETAPVTWERFVSMGGISKVGANLRVFVDVERGSDPQLWRLSLLPVPAEKWRAVEWRSGMRKGERWEPVAVSAGEAGSGDERPSRNRG